MGLSSHHERDHSPVLERGAFAKRVMELDHCLLLIRHGQTQWNAEDCIATRTDVSLSECGRSQALALATSLRGGEFDRVWSSPRSRAQETARIGLARAHVITPEIVVDRRLEEIDAGPFEGICFANLFKDTAAGRQYQAYAREIDPVYPKGAESSEDAAARASSFLQEIATLGGGHYLAFSHGGLMRILVCAFLGLDPCHYRRIKIDNCHGVLLKFYEQPPHQLAGLNISPTD